jgi:putative drug exporter of the RND superfamily
MSTSLLDTREHPGPPSHRARPPGNLAARIAQFSARHRFTAIGGWLLFVIAATALSAMIGSVTATDSEYDNGESRRADQMIEAAGFPDPAGEMVLVQSGRLAASDPAFRAAVNEVTAAVKGTGQVQNLRPAVISEDKHSALVTFEMTGDSDTAKDRVGPVMDAVAKVQKAHPDLYVAQGGDASGDKVIGESLEKDFSRLSLLSLPLTLGILIIAFGALLAAVLPVGLALTAFMGAMGLLAAASRLFHNVDATTHVMLLVGLAIGVDYCLFYIRREREERAKGADPERALGIAAATSGRSILISGLTVIIAMAGMFLTGNTVFESFAAATILVVAVAVAGSLTVLPALLSKLGDRVDLGKIPGLYRRESNGRFWKAVLGVVMRRPGISATLAGGVLVALAVPAFALHTASPGVQDFSSDMPMVQTYKKIQAAFPGGAEPVEVVVSAPDVNAAPVRAAIDKFKSEALATGQMHEPIDVQVSPNRTAAVVSVGLSGSGTDATSEKAVRTLREDVIPATLGRVDGAKVAVTSSTASSVDFTASLDRSIPLVFAFVLGLAFLLLLVSFRSVVIAATSIVLNLLSVAAAYGLLVAVFQWGWGENLLNFQSNGAIADWLPLFLFVILFGLSMDYHVFVLSRIREGHDKGWPTKLAVSRGVRGTAGVITSAAVVMVAVFSLFATMSMNSTKQMGIGLAAAVLLDATLVRAVLLPAVMAMLGERNWYLPRWLRWLPRVSHN